MNNHNNTNIKNISNENIEEILDKVIESTAYPYIEQIKKTGLKEQISIRVPGFDIEEKIISITKRYLSPVREIELGKRIGRATIGYKNGKIIIKPSGTFALFINEITITDAQIIAAFDSVLEQIQDKYINDLSFIKIKAAEIIQSLSDTGIYKPKTSEEKTLYDLVLLILLNYDFEMEGNLPDWIKEAICNLKREEIINRLILTIRDHISMIATIISENIYIDLKRAIDSRIVRVTLSRKTNKGQIASFLKLFGINIKSKIEEFSEDYMSPSFVKGVGEIIVSLANSFLYDVKDDASELEDNIDNRLKPFDITLTLGKEPKTQRAFRWYTSQNIKESYLYLSKTKSFVDCLIIKAEYENVLNPKTVYNLGPLSKYTVAKVSKFSAEISNLEQNSLYYYRVGDKNTNNLSETMSFKTGQESDSFTFITLTDSQGMVKSNYDLFNNTFNEAINRFSDAEFVAHLGDFVDDGNNEDYWEWLFESKIWRRNAVVPVSGNHEARVNHAVFESGAENSIVSHFNVQGYPKQDTSTGVYYSFEYKNATFIILNTNDLDKNKKINIEQYRWALRVANNAKTRWKIILAHKSPYSNGPHHDDGDVESLKDQIIELCNKAKIDILLAGHDHVYVRTPIMLNGKKSRYNDKIIKRNGIKYETAINPNGTVFITPGTSGVKNYSQDMSVIIPSDFMAQPSLPVYSAIRVEKDIIYFSSYKYKDAKGKSYLLDSFAIEKTEDKKILNETIKQDKLDKNYNNVNNSLEVTVRNRYEFIQALEDESVGTIVTEGNDIKIETAFGKNRKQIINRDICIKGSSCIYNVTFKVKNNATLIIKDLVCIDNTRTQGSLFPASNCVELYDNSTLVMEDYASLRTEYGIGIKGFCVYIFGKNAKAYFKSQSINWGSKGSISSNQKDSVIVIDSGVFSSKGRKNAIKTDGTIIINDGNVKDILGSRNSKIFLNGGTIGNTRDLNPKVPITVYNEMYFTGGKIKESNNISINLSDKNSRLHIKPIHEGAVDINGIKPYLSKIKTDNYNEVYSYFNKYIKEPRYQTYDKICVSKNKVFDFEELVNAKYEEVLSNLSDNIKASIPEGEYYVWAKALFVSNDKIVSGIKCNSGAKSFVYTDPRHIINYPVEKIYIEKVDTIEYSENENNKYQLSYISSPREALGDNVFWSVDNVEVADIDYNGVLTVKAPGRVKVTAFLQSNDRIFCRREIKII